MSFLRLSPSLLATALALCAGTAAQAANVNAIVTVENLAAANILSFAPLHLGFNNGSFDAFNIGSAAGAGIVSVAESGVGGQWQADFAAADPTAVRGTIGGLLQPGATQSLSFVVDSAVNPFFTFAAMAVPSNDFFIGNDSPTEYRLFNSLGQLQISSINIKASEIWDAGSEVFNPAAAAFVGTGSLRADQNSVVAFNFAEYYGFNGLTTGAGYTFDSQLGADTDVYRISLALAPVPEPESYALMLVGLAAMGAMVRRRRRAAWPFLTPIAGPTPARLWVGDVEPIFRRRHAADDWACDHWAGHCLCGPRWQHGPLPATKRTEGKDKPRSSSQQQTRQPLKFVHVVGDQGPAIAAGVRRNVQFTPMARPADSISAQMARWSSEALALYDHTPAGWRSPSPRSGCAPLHAPFRAVVRLAQGNGRDRHAPGVLVEHPQSPAAGSA